MADPSELIPRGSARIRAEIAEAPACYRLELARGQDVESGFVPFRGNVSIAKGKPPAQIPYYGPDALAYLTPDYLRNLVAPVYAKPGPDAVVVDDGDAVLLWDGSNAGESFRGRAGMAASTMARLAPSTIFYSAYFVHALKSLERILKSKTNGTGIPHVDREVLEALRLYCPSLGAQHAVARVLDNLDAAIHQTEAIIAKLKLVKQGLLHDLLTRGIDANGELRPQQSEAPHLYKSSPLGWIPKEWGCVRLSEKLAVLGGKRLPAGHAYADHLTAFKYLRVTDFFERDYAVEDLENLHEGTFKALERYEIEPEQLYVSIAGSLGYVGVHRSVGAKDVRTVLTENAARLAPLCELVPGFIAAYMNSAMVQSQVTTEKGTGGGVPKLALFRIEQFWLAWPPKGEQAAVAERIRSADKQILDEGRFLQKKMLEKAGLMDDLLTGRVRVTPMLEAAAAP